MANILHITDLHLVSKADSEALESHKVGLVPHGDRATRHRLLRYTLQILGQQLSQESQPLDAVVVTGDVAEKNNPGGYIAFLDLLEALGDAKPPSSHILVAPGNHDVKAGLEPGDSHRYEEFLKHIRDAGYITPWLEGVDGAITTADAAREHLIALEDIQIVAIDSAAYSQVLMNIGIPDKSWKELEAVLREPEELAALRRLRVVDAARISNAQLEAIQQILRHTTPKEEMALLRIAALHHHLLPVSITEEIKPFESLINLGRVRQFLRDEGFAIVLHGHKHKLFTYVDYITSYNEGSDRTALVRVVSGAAAGGADLDQGDVCRLIAIDSVGGIMRVQRVGLSAPGSPLNLKSQDTLTFSRPGAAQAVSTPGYTVIQGETVALAYPRLITTFGEKADELEHVICRVEQSPEIHEIAPIYPKLPAWGDGDRLKEFNDLIEWWQISSIPVNSDEQGAFTHGSRIRAFNGYLDQLREVIESLKVRSSTSRSMIVLLNPPADQIANHEIQFPSFCIVQFTVHKNGGVPTLACTAYFRKQEIRYWWLVNLAELSKLQREICDALGQDIQSELRSIKPGPITTVAARAHAGKSPPKVQVPLLERWNRLARERLYAMVHSLIWEAMPDRTAHAGEWRRIFSELMPAETRDPDGVPVALEGLKYLLKEISLHLQQSNMRSDSLNSLHSKIQNLLMANQAFALDQKDDNITTGRYEEWRNEVTPLIHEIIELGSGLILSRVQTGKET